MSISPDPLVKLDLVGRIEFVDEMYFNTQKKGSGDGGIVIGGSLEWRS